MEIRRATARDAEAVAETFLAARAQLSFLPRLHADAEVRAWIRDVLLLTREVWVAEEDGRAIGFAALAGNMLEHLYVHPAEQGKGIGSTLLARAKRQSPAGLRLWVFQRNERARRFYERHGFALVRVTDGAANEEHEPDALYDWRPQ